MGSSPTSHTINKEIMLPHQERVVEERTQLDIKIAALLAFRTTKIWQGLDLDDKLLLSDQLEYMQAYSVILSKRIARFQT